MNYSQGTMFIVKKIMRISYRFYIASIIIGTISGFVCVAFRFLINIINSSRILIFKEGNRSDFQRIADGGLSSEQVLLVVFKYLILFSFTAISLHVIHRIIRKYPTTSGSGLPQTKALLEGKMRYRSPIRNIAAKFCGGILSIASGLSLGREGSSVQMGSLIGFIFADRLKTGDGNYLIAAGAGAGISAAFTAPLASSILIIESLRNKNTSDIKKLTISTLLSGLCAGITATFFFPTNLYSSTTIVKPDLQQSQLLFIFILMALLFAFSGKIFSHLLISIKVKYDATMSSHTSRYLAIALAVCVLTFFYPSLVGGNQAFVVEIIDDSNYCLTNNLFLLSLLSIITVLSNATGFPGGLFIPLLSMGGLLGKIFCIILSRLGIVSLSCTGYFVLVGMSILFISVVRTPLTGFVLISEMTGNYDVMFTTLVVGILAYIITEIIKVRPIDDILYDIMIRKINTHSNYS